MELSEAARIDGLGREPYALRRLRLRGDCHVRPGPEGRGCGRAARGALPRGQPVFGGPLLHARYGHVRNDGEIQYLYLHLYFSSNKLIKIHKGNILNHDEKCSTEGGLNFLSFFWNDRKK